MTLLEKAVEKTGWAPETIRDKLCPSDLDLEEDQSTMDGSCRVLGTVGSCRACWGREVESGRQIAAPTEETEPLPPAAPTPKGEAG